MKSTSRGSSWALTGLLVGGVLFSFSARADEGGGGREPVQRRSNDRPSATASRHQQPDDRRGDARHPSSTRQHPRPRSYGSGWGHGGNWGHGWYPYNWYWGSAWGPSVYYSSGGGRNYSLDYDDGAGALDLDLEPERAEVYVDGRLVGRADDFDGFPTYLWLPRGTYDVVFYLPGYRTLARQYSIYPGLVIDIEDQMELGDSVRPDDLVSRSTERRDDRLRRDEERRSDVERRLGGPRDPDNWREREREREPDSWRERREEADAEREGTAAQPEASRTERGVTVRLRVEPSDAAVYLDGRFLGEADGVDESLTVTEGSHTIELVRPGYRSTTRTFTAQSGDALTLDLRLEQQ